MAEITAALTLDAGPATVTAKTLGDTAQGAARQVDSLAASQRKLNTETEKAAALSAVVERQSEQETAAFLQRMNAFKAETEQMLAAKQAAAAAKAQQASLAAETASLTSGTMGFVTAIAEVAIGAVTSIGVIALLSTAYDFLTKRTREAKQAAGEFSKSNEGLTARANVQAIERNVSGGAAFTDRLFGQVDLVAKTKEINAAAQAWRGFRAELESGDTGNIGIARFGAVNQQLIALRRELAAGKITVEQFQHGLTELDRSFPGFESEIVKTRELGAMFDEAAKAVARLQAAEANRAAEGRSLIATHGQPGTSFERGGDDAVKLAAGRKALADAQTRANAADAGGSLGVQTIDDQRAAVDKATEKWKEYVVATGNAVLANTAYTDALGHHNAVASQFLHDAQAEIAANEQVTRSIAMRAELTRGSGEVAKQRALNDAFNEGGEAAKLLAIHYDALNKKKQDALSHTPEEIAKLNATTDAMAAQQARAVLLAGTRQRSESVRDASQAADAAATSAEQERALVGLSTEAIARKRIEYAALNALTAAHNKLLADQAHADTAEKKAADDRYQAQVRAINANKGHDLAGLDVATSSTTDAMKESREAIEAENAALLSGATARKGYEIDLRAQLELKKAQQIVDPALRAEREKEIENTRQASQEHRVLAEAMQKAEQRAEQLRHVLSQTFNTFLTDLLTKGKNVFQSLWDSAKAGFFRMVSDLIAAQLVEKFKEMMGVGPNAAAKRNDHAADVMNEASKRNLEAANKMAGIHGATGGDTVPGDGLPEGEVQKQASKLAKIFETAGKYAAVAIAGYSVGYGTGQSMYSTSHGAAGNYARGAVGGAVSGALTGAALGTAILPGAGTVVGAVVGGIAGFIGGIVGVHNASKEAAKATAELRKQLELNMASLRAQVNHDDLGAAIAQVNAQRETLRKQIEDAYSGGGANSDTVRERNKQLAEMNALEDKYIAQLKEEAAAKRQYFSEDLNVEQERARATIAESQGNPAEAKRLRDDADRTAYNQEQERRLDDYLRTHDIVNNKDDAAQYAQLQNTVALNEQAFAVQQNTKAVNDLTTSLHNAPSGYKVEADIYRFATPAQRPAQPGQWATPTTPFRPPTSPLNPPGITADLATTLFRDPMRELSQELSSLRGVLASGPATASRLPSPTAPLAQGGRSIVISFAPVIDGTKATRTLAKDLAVEFKKIASETLGTDADPADALGLLAP